MHRLSEEEIQRRKVIGINADTVTDIAATDFPGHYPGEDNSWYLKEFKKNFQVKFHQNSPLDSSFSLVGIDASIANAFRRILIAEIPTLAIEQVFIFSNTSLIQDEVLAHRLGLVPLQGNKDGLRWLRWYKKATEDDPTSDVPSDHNTVILHLHVECTWQENGKELYKKGETNPHKLYDNSTVYARQMTFQPTGQQSAYFTLPASSSQTSTSPSSTSSSSSNAIKPVHPDILLAKLRPGQNINLSMHCIKGIGRDHAKFSPVATASYRLLPQINIIQPIIGADARKFARCFPKGVIGLEEITAKHVEAERRQLTEKQKLKREQKQRLNAKSGKVNSDDDVNMNEEEDVDGQNAFRGHLGDVMAVVKDPMRDTVSRECLRHEEFEGKVKLGRIRDHFIYRIESTGQWDSDELFLESIKVLKMKCGLMKKGLADLMRV